MADPQKELIIFEAGSTKITTSRAVIGAKTYAMSNITSVSLAKKRT